MKRAVAFVVLIPVFVLLGLLAFTADNRLFNWAGDVWTGHR